jgi:sigma-B regulation protein RsbU (phosphoserine phosphatase)
MHIREGSMDIEQINLLINLISKINSNFEVDTLLHEIMEASKVIMKAEASSLYLLSEDKTELILTVPTGPATAELSGKTIPSSRGISGWAVQFRQSLIIDDVHNDPRFLGELTEEYEFKSKNMICVPLINHKDQIIGALQAINKLQGNGFTSDDLPLFQTLANHAAIAIENTLLQQQRLEKEVLDKELDVARKIQSGFWPKNIPEIENYQVTGYSRAAKSVGGDYFDYFEIPNSENWGFTVADVSGKGVPASLLMATMRASLRSHVENSHSVVKSMNLVNKIIFEDSPIDKFITAVYGVLDTEKHTFRYVNAGHNNPYLVCPEKKEITPLETSGVMLGIINPIDFEEHVIEIKPGQKLVIFSDGIPEAQNVDDDFFSDEAFEEWLCEHSDLGASQMMVKLLDTIHRFCEGANQSDDITLIIVERISDFEAQPQLF